MRWILLVIFAVLLNGFEVNIKEVNGDKIYLDKYVRKGKSGYVICPYDNTNTICARAVSFGNYAKLYVYDDLKNDAFALPDVKPEKGNKVIFGKDDSRIMIIAPNQNVYLKVMDMYKNCTVISTDLFVPYIEEKPAEKDFISFAKKMNIGKIVFVLDKIYEVDPYSFYVLKKFGQNSAKYEKIFFTTYPNFDIKLQNAVKYYKHMIKE